MGGSSGTTVKPLDFRWNGECISSVFGDGNGDGCKTWDNARNLEEEQRKLAADIAAGNDKDGKKTARLTELVLQDARKFAATYLGAEAAAGVVAIGLYLAAAQYSPRENLQIALALRLWVRVGPASEVRIGLENVGRYVRPYLDSVSAAAKAPKLTVGPRGPVPNVASFHPNARGSEAEDAVLWAVGLRKTRDGGGARAEADGFWDVLPLGFLLSGFLRNLGVRAAVGAGGALEAEQLAASPLAKALAGASSDHIVLGLGAYGLEDTALIVGGRTLLNDGNWMATLEAAIADPNVTITRPPAKVEASVKL